MSTQEIPTDKLVRAFIRIRAKRAELTREYSVLDEDLKVKLRQVENELLGRAQAQGLKGFSTPEGTTYTKEDQHVSIADPDEFMKFVQAEGDLLFYEQRPSLGHIREYQKAHDGLLPPGVRMFRENRMRVRAVNKGGKENDD